VDFVITRRAPLQRAEIIAVGSELLGAMRLDTNSLFLSERLASLGIELRAKAVVGDNRQDLAAVFRRALERADLVILTGGLGPTDDDVTRDVVAEVLDLPMEEDYGIVERIERRFARRGLQMPEINRRQARVPRGATPLDNPNGTAPGLVIDHDGALVILLPGPPRELQPMFEALMLRVLADRAGPERFFRMQMLVTGRSESHVEEAIRPMYAPWRSHTPSMDVTILAAPGQIELHLTTRSADAAAAERALASARDHIVATLGEDVFSTDGRSMEQIVGDLLRERGFTIAVAESCTGGLLLSRLTDVPGSSEYVLAGVVAYNNAAKVDFADVDRAMIEANGAVSEPVAVALAEGVRARTGAALGVGVTGIAGPGGGTPRKPVGTVAVAALGPAGGVRVRTFWFPGNRAQVKFQATQAGLDLVRRMILQHAPLSRS
jgi:nicotinamide-nucleotide amidase